MKKISVFLCLLAFTCSFAQFSGERSDEPYNAIDGVVYKKGDTLQIANPSKGNEFQSIYIYKHVTALESGLKVLDTGSKLLGIFSGGGSSSSNSSEDAKIILAPKSINGFQGKINHFRILSLKNTQKTKITYAIVEYLNGYRLAVPIDMALQYREMHSKNPEFKKQLISEATGVKDNETTVKSFNNNFDVRFISAIGDKNNQTVKITFTVKHDLVHQVLKILSKEYLSYNLGTKYSEAYDFEGNKYDPKELVIGTQVSEYVVESKIPTNVLVRGSITFKKILPKIKELSFVNILTKHGNNDDGEREIGNIEISNVKIDWK